MILTDREIEAALMSSAITLEPKPLREHYSPSTVDLTLHNIYKTWKRSTHAALSTTVDSSKINNELLATFTDEHMMSSDGLVLEPNDFILAWTAATLTLPHTARLAARVEGKSSLARGGLVVHQTAPTIHPGFTGRIQLEIRNQGPLKLLIKPGQKICQLIFEQTLGTPNDGYKGLFNGQG